MKKRRILRWLGWAAAVGFGWLAYAYLTLPDVRPLADEQSGRRPRSSSCARARRARSGKRRAAMQRWVPTAGSRRT